MSLISTKKISKNFGDRELFSNLSINIPAKARIGLVGRNGIGKSTLLEILAGIQSPSGGEVNHARDLKIAYLPQVSQYSSEATLWESSLEAFDYLERIKNELSVLEKQMMDNGDDTELLNKYSIVQERYEQLGGYTYEVRARQVLSGLGFAEQHMGCPLIQLSGGQRTRALFAKLILSDPDILLLDEPTNYLDVASIEWLEAYMKEWQGAAVIVSHDRYFLDQVVNNIWELDPDIEMYHGNYSAYTMQREERYLRKLEEYRRQKRFIDKEQEYIRKNIAGQNTKQAQGRRKRLERMLRESKLYKPNRAKDINIKIKSIGRSGDQIIKTKSLKIGYLDSPKPLFNTPDIILKRGECVALIGPNGAGKTTFIKTMLGQIPPYAGEVTMGSSLVIGYFEQAHQSLKPTNTVMQEIELAAPNMLPEEIRKFLAKYQFTEDDVFLQVSVLSGGERARLALALLSLKNANLLLLDEPTSHLDISSQEILQTILETYDGTIILVSHDRYLISALATQVWEISPTASSMNVFLGSYNEYRSKQLSQAGIEEKANNTNKRTYKTKPQGISKARLKQLQEKNKALEEEIESLEKEMQYITKSIESSGDDFIKIQKLGSKYSVLENKLEKVFSEWEALNNTE